MNKKAVFFDRDGTLIVDKHYLHDPDQIEYFSDTFKTLLELQKRGYELFMVTNQSGIGRGFFPIEKMHLVHKKMLADFKHQGIRFTDVAFCPHAPEENCLCRKPHPKMLIELCQKYQIDPKQSFMVGDKVIDVECGERAQMKGIQIDPKEPEFLTHLLSIIL